MDYYSLTNPQRWKAEVAKLADPQQTVYSQSGSLSTIDRAERRKKSIGQIPTLQPLSYTANLYYQYKANNYTTKPHDNNNRIVVKNLQSQSPVFTSFMDKSLMILIYIYII